ncbi:MAG: hypothetical protein JRJ41_13570 [Deltaproteobacteria bacterium]|jgi:hypothetical protein|nr:hypothetical protein [Deltaproteobacteria bacterium]
MTKKTDSTQSQNGSVLMIGKRNRKIEELERRLAEYFNKIYLVADLAKGVNLSPTDIYTLIVVTDSTGHLLNKDFFSKLRAHFSRSVLVCLVDQITQETEKAMRGAGLLFLGSYHQFSEYYRSILESAIEAKRIEMLNSLFVMGTERKLT